MKKVIISILNKHFKNCLYSSIMIDKLYELVGGEFPINEIERPDDGWKWIQVNSSIIIKLKISESKYISDIDVEEAD